MQKIKEYIFMIFKKIGNIPCIFMVALITLYRSLISPLLPSCCRYIPTCSQYSIEAFKRFGFINGSRLTILRIIRCRPGGSYGYDPVPEDLPWKKIHS